ncbi:translation initiation factor eif-2b [Coprinopsis cinerea okayama7|uniref:Translation initiation factor eIF2B subunit epsilon n=1 Tax=Coprinopsis cinerea (strain Okayama-7 / 130 / ATCC MYA-4618 / FGSC 9003) TaxID=240176 RepID=A8NFR3_COPC7|nr:translation initiation factor eif-2b [Coprinopsis cinerea okayama7\|eukprot:XP_001833349.1 translation initiation factor eif-2b [Coprinopsis cinerea okayama7\
MASKSSGKDKLLDEQDEILQAVVLADSWNRRFRPLTTNKPRCLLPICNAPLLDWTFESLSLAGVQEVFVLCRSHSGQVKKAIRESKWSKPGSGMKIVPVMTAKETFSAGDAMRDIYTRGLVTSDFVLVSGDLVSNIRIDEVVKAHKERRRTNKDAIMTMVVKEASVEHRTRSQGESAVFVVDPSNYECLHYESVLGHPRKTVVDVPREVLASRKEVEIRYDLIDCCIDVCSVEVPSLFQDNFDYLDIRRDFVHGVLTSDLLMKSIHLYVAQDGYAARVRDTKSYESISKDILSRWTFPLVPDDNYPGSTRYEHTRGNRYLAKDKSPILARTCKIGINTLIGASTEISDNVEIKSSVIGPNCVIGPNTIIENSYIFQGTTIGADCRITKSIVGVNADIKDGSVIEKGGVVGDQVVLGPNAKLSPFERVSIPWKKLKEEAKADGVKSDRSEGDSEDEEDSLSDEEDEDSDIEEVEAAQDSLDKSKLGPASNAILWPDTPPEDEDSDDEDNVENYTNQRFMRMADDIRFSDDFDDTGDAAKALRSPSTTSLTSGVRDAEKEFRSEVVQSLERAFVENHSLDNAAVELKTLRMASNVPLSRVKEVVIATLVERIPLVEEGGIAQRKEIHTVLGRWGQLINRIGGVDPVETLVMLQRHCIGSPRLSLFGQILAALYQHDVVEEEDLIAWHRTPGAKGEDANPGPEQDNLKKTWLVGGQLIVQLAEQDSEDDSDEDDDDEESDD